jgi:hypothetical protein
MSDGRFATALCILSLAVTAAGCGDGPAPSSVKLPVSFPPGFRLGFATIAYQSEGDIKGDGSRVDSNWSEWEDLGKIAEGQHNLRGNGFFDHYDVDLDLAAGIGANAFSYSLDWARIEPQEDRGRNDVPLQPVPELVAGRGCLMQQPESFVPGCRRRPRS